MEYSKLTNEISNLLFEHLSSNRKAIYCPTCRYKRSVENCDCNRKMIAWSISEEYANELAQKILKLVESEDE